jgi:serralysin
MPTQLWRTSGTGFDDFIIGGGGDSTINGGDGDDYIIGDSITPFGTGTSTNPLAPTNIDNSGRWTTGENPFVTDPTVPYTSLYVQTVAGSKAYSSVTVGAGETITVDVDFGWHPIGGNTDTMVVLLDSIGNQVAIDDDFHGNYEGGSQSTLDSFLTFTNNSGSAQTYTIVFQEFGDDNLFEGDETFVANISVTGHAATASVVSGNDTLTGSLGDDTLAGQAGDDNLSGGDGNDDLFGGSGNDMLDGGLGTDTAWYNDAVSAVTVDLRKTWAQDTGGAGTDTLTNMESLVGSQYDDHLYGDDNYNVIHGGAGADTIYGFGSNDYLYGEDGSDTIYGGDGDDTIYADVSNYSAWSDNTLFGGTGNDFIVGWLGNDSLNGNDGDDIISDAGGNDVIAGGPGIDTLQYFSATAGVTVNLSITTAQNTVGAGTDTITGIENLTGGFYADTLTGNGISNTLNGSYGNDKLFGGAGNDTLLGGYDNDVLAGGTGNDILTGDVGNDRFRFDTALNAVNNVDQITDFTVSDDTIQIDDDVFTAAGPVGTLAGDAFFIGTAAGDANDRIIYDSTTGNLYYDSDGTGAAAQILFAHVSAGLALTNADFQVIG